MRVGIADHFGWAVCVTADADHQVIDRRRIELLEPGVPNAPMHHESHSLDLEATRVLVEEVRASIARASTAAFDTLAADVGAPVTSISMRALPADFPADLEVLRQAPWESRADGVMYREVLVEVAEARGWPVHFYLAKDVLDQAADALGPKADEVLEGPRARLGPPWTKDHRMALAATVLAG